ncbi:hypothetical protein HA402_012868 [Bradysia odoriphaga]|nr:hypothetical protein HA402_012868 [Bradysia odoriphaga]
MSDSECSSGSNADTSSSDSDSNSETSNVILEPARILKQHLELPKGLCDNVNIFNEFFSLDTWNNLPEPIKDHLVSFLPNFTTDPLVNRREQDATVERFFKHEIHRFGASPLRDFQKNLEDGNFQPDISRLRSNIQKSLRREQKFQECEHLSRLAKSLALSRERLLKAAYESPYGATLKVERVIHGTNKLSTSAAAMRAKKRYFQDITTISEDVGLNPSLSDDENYPEGPPAQLSRKQRRHLSGIQGGAASPGAELRILGTLSSQGGTLDHLVGPGGTAALSEDFYRQIIQQHRKRKVDESDHPELDTKGLNLNDIFERTQLSAGHRRQIAQGSKQSSTKKSQAIKIKTEPQNSTTAASSPLNNSEHPISGFQQQLNKSQSLLMIGRMNSQAGNSDSDDDLDIKQERISPTESKSATSHRNNHGPKAKRKMNSTSMAKKMAKKMKLSGNVQLGHSSANSSSVRVKEENITIHHDPIVSIKSEPTTITPSITTMSKYVSAAKPVTLSDLDGIDMMNLPIDLEDCSNIDIVNDVDDNQIVYRTPELMQETHVCYFSLIRDIFCSTQYHRTTMDTLQDKVSSWLSNPITALNDWYSQADDCFLAGDFADQPEDFVPYLEYKKSMHIYQWIGAGRDSDQHLSPLCDYWLNRRNEMGATQSGFSDDDDMQLNELSFGRYNSGSEMNDSGTIADRSLSPLLPPRCPTTWTVGKASAAEIEEFRQQERRRFENPHMSFTYRMHGFESVVGPVKGIYTQLPAFTKARGHNMLTIDRPNFVTILTLVRDATARLPNGEGTRADICELLRSSQYINPEAADNVLQTIVSGALDRMHTENDPCVKYDPKRKIWIYLHRNRTEEEFERMHQQFQGKSKHKKQSTRKIKTKTGKACVIGKPTDVVPNIQQKSVLVPITRTAAVVPQTKPNVLLSTPIQATARLLPSSQVVVTNEPKLKSDAQLISSQPSFQLPALSSIQSPSLVQISNQPPLLNKITSKSPAIKAELVPIKQTNVQKVDKMEHIDVEASLEAHTTPILVNKNSPQMPSLIVDNKFSKIINQKTKKQVPALVTPSSNLSNTMSPLTTATALSSTTPIKVSTSSGIQTVHVSSAFTVPGKSMKTMTSGQSILINQNQSQPPLYVTNKKIIKPPPLVPQSSPSNQNFIIPINISLNQSINKAAINQQSAKLIKTAMPALTSTSAPKSLLQQQQQQQVLKPIQRSVQPGKSLINPSVAAANITLQQQQKLLSSNTPNAQVQIRAQQQPKLTATTVKAQGTTMSPVQQRQILQNIISQQQKQQNQRPNMISLVSSNSVIVNSTQSNQIQGTQFQAAMQPQQTLQQSKTVIVSQPNLVQKIVTNPPTIAASINSTTSTPSDSNPINSQIIQIHQMNQQPGKVQRVSAASLTPQQQQNLLQSIKQQQIRVQQTGSPQQQSLIIKQQQVLQQIQKQQPTLIQQPVGSPKPGTSLLTSNATSQVPTIIASVAQSMSSSVQQPQQTITRIVKPGTATLVSSSGHPVSTVRATTSSNAVMAKVFTNSAGQIISLDSILQKQGLAPGTTLRVAGAKPGQTSLIQLASGPGSQITQYAVVSQPRNLISLAQPQRLITTQAASSTVQTTLATAVKTETTTSARPATILQQIQQSQSVATSTQQQPKLVQSITPQQLVNATKVLGVQSVLPGNRLKPGIRMVNASNLNVAQFAGKPIIIASKTAKTGTTQQQNVIWQQQGTSASNSTNYVISGQPGLKVQNNVLSHFEQPTSQTQTVMFGNQVVRLQSPNQIAVTNSLAGNSSGRTVMLGAAGQTIRVHSPAQQNQIAGSNQQQQIVLQQGVKTAVKVPQTVGSSGQQRVVLTVQGGGQIILPQNFQGGAINLKSLQGLKVIPIQQQNKGTNDDRQIFAQIISSPQAPRPPNSGES